MNIRISDSTIRKYRPKNRPAPSDQTWKTFLQNHAQALVAVDFFAVPTATFRVLYVFLVLAHERRKVLHFNITEAPSASWTAQQMVEAFPYTIPPHYLLRDRDAIYGADFTQRVQALGLEQKLIAPRSPVPAAADAEADGPSQRVSRVKDYYREGFENSLLIIREMRALGKRSIEIVERLNAENLPTKTGRKWTSPILHQTLRTLR